jgi:hypothetical protein
MHLILLVIERNAQALGTTCLMMAPNRQVMEPRYSLPPKSRSKEWPMARKGLPARSHAGT